MNSYLLIYVLPYSFWLYLSTSISCSFCASWRLLLSTSILSLAFPLILPAWLLPGGSLLANEGNIYSECTKGLFQSIFQWRMLKGLQWHFEQLPMFLLFSMRVWIQFSVKTNTMILLGILKIKCKTLMIQMIRKKDLCLSEKNDNQLSWIWILLITNKNDCKDIIPLLFHILSYKNLNIM